MSFQSNVLRNGEWVTERVDIKDALRASAAPQATTSEPRASPPTCGILSRTVIESPAVKWVLPVRLRSRSHNDVAFIGDRYVQICEMQPDGQVHEVIRKSDFGLRIRNAVVLGDYLEDSANESVDEDVPGLVEDETDVSMQDSSTSGSHGIHPVKPLPPQLLVLMLETGDCVFLFVRERPDGNLECGTVTYEGPKGIVYLGYHLSVDPTSRYMVAADVEGVFIIYELETLANLNSQYIRRGTFDPIRSFRARTINGIAQKIEFLHPQPGDDHHIILLLIFACHEGCPSVGVSRMMIFEWELEDDLRKILAKERTGTPLPSEHRMPLLIIPLRFKNAFFAVSQNSIGIVKFALSGSPEFELLQTDTPGKTRLHHGVGDPLWTAWARPFRRKKYFEKTDIIFLAREDGVIIHIEIDSSDLLPSVTRVGSLDTNISTAFTLAYDRFADVIIIGGDSGPGGIWQLPPRSDLEQVGVLPNWSPVIDVATTDENPTWIGETGNTSTSRQGDSRMRIDRPDRIFTASGSGYKGNITELRWGIHARIGLELDLAEPVRQSWMFPITVGEVKSFNTLHSLPHSSTVLEIPSDLSQAYALSPESTPFDTTSRTLCAAQNGDGIITQVTEASTTIITPSQSSRHSHEDVCDSNGVVAENAACLGDAVVISSHSNQGSPASHLYVLRIDQMNISQANSWDTKGDVTCICLFNVSENGFIATGSVINGIPWLLVYSLDGQLVASKAIELHADSSIEGGHSQMEAFTSVCVFDTEANEVGLVLGTRSGHIVTSRVSDQSPDRIQFSVEKLASVPVYVSQTSGPFNGKPAVFACCDHNLVLMSDYCSQSMKLKTKNFVWPTDSSKLSMPSPPVHSIYCLQQSLTGQHGHMSLLLGSGTRIFLTDIWPHVGPVPRSIQMNGGPSRIIFSHTWKCLVVALNSDGRTTLAFIDPDTGDSIANPTDKDQTPVNFISGLGRTRDRILALCEWLYVKDGRTFSFIIVATMSGRLLIISVGARTVQTDHGAARRLNYWTRHKKAYPEPISAIVGDARGLIFCVGNTLHWEVLDLTEKKLKPMKEYRLDSAAQSLRLANGKICVLTSSHSLQVIDHGTETAEMRLMHCDVRARYATHHIDIGSSLEPPGKWPVSVLATLQGGIAGVWIPWGEPNKEFRPVFEGTLPMTIRRFFRGHIRPLWISAERRPRYNCLANTIDGAENFAVALDGTLLHLSLLGVELWRFLRLVQSLAERSPAIYPCKGLGLYDSEPELEPQPELRIMHIDGDLLERCLRSRALESLVETGGCLDLFYKYLDAIEGGIYTNKFRHGIGDGNQLQKKYFELGYEILEYLLAPVL